MNKKDRESCINTVKLLRRLALNIHGCIGVVDDQNCDKMIEILESETHEKRTETHACDLISRRKAFEYFVTLWECIGTIMDRDEWEDACMTTANEIPSAQPETGKWDFIGYQQFQCTKCGVIYTQEQLEGLKQSDDDLFPNYCPNCGVKMRGEQE